MEKKLNSRQYTLIASMLFGLFFGAGNLIFPIILGARSGQNIVPAIIGMLITAVGMPLLGIVSMGISNSSGLMHMSGRVSKWYSYFFTLALYLTIGPLFAIPRCAATSFSMGISPMVSNDNQILFHWIFTFLFFIAVLFFSLRPSNIMNSVGKWLNPIFLVLLCILTVSVIVSPETAIGNVPASGDYAGNAFSTGFLQGYDTLDILASLAFGIIVINVIKGYGVEDPKEVAKSTVKSGVFSMAFMAVIYVMIAVVGAEGYGLYADKLSDPNFTGGDAFAAIANHYFGKSGLILIALIVTFCCLKTAVGLVTSCSETFSQTFPNSLSYRTYAIIFTAASFLISNIGLAKIIEFSIPVLYFLYPLAIVLIITTLFGKLFGHSRYVYISAISFTMVSAIFDLFRVSGAKSLSGIVAWGEKWLPLYDLGLGWILPSAFGIAVGLIIMVIKRRQKN